MTTAHSSIRPSQPENPDKWFPPPQGEWTYNDYARLPDNGYRYEVIDGNLYMTPSPNWFHQEAVTELARLLRNHLDDQGGKALVAPSDVRLKDIGSPVQPDLYVVLKQNLAMLKDDGRVDGVPDIVVEVLSPSSQTYDRRTKLDAYFRAGVPEYWIVDPERRIVTVYVRRGDTFPGVEIGEGNNIRSEVLPDFHAPVASLFAR